MLREILPWFAVLALLACGKDSTGPQVLGPFVLAVTAPVTPNIAGGCVVTIGFSDGYTAPDRQFVSTNIAVTAARGGAVATDTLWMTPGHYHGVKDTNGSVQSIRLAVRDRCTRTVRRGVLNVSPKEGNMLRKDAKQRSARRCAGAAKGTVAEIVADFQETRWPHTFSGQGPFVNHVGCRA